jgi:sensor histidine kinase YesM
MFFFSVSLFNELSFSSTFSRDPGWNVFLKTLLSQSLIYAVKAFVVYYCMYSLIPRWSAKKSSFTDSSFTATGKYGLKYLVEYILILLAGAFCIRLIVQQIIWVYVFPNGVSTLNFFSLFARYIYSLFDLIPITVVAIAIKLVQLRFATLRHESLLVNEKMRSELQFLKAQTNPHFLFNTLNSIYALSRKQDEQTPKAILNLSKILRYMLYETSHSTNPIRNELQLIEDYIALQKLRFQDHLTVNYQKDLEDEDTGISPLLLLPLVENAFKHSDGLDTHISIHVVLADGLLKFTITNSLSESPEASKLIQDGIGLSNIKRQLAILYKDYNFTARKNDTEFVVDLSIQLNSYSYV